jgi:cytochrome c biogenesis protein CcmG/thiol:disulfide interchange protein DsbE
MMSGNEPATVPAMLKTSLRSWAAAAGRGIGQHKIAAGLTAVVLAVAVAATVIGAPGHARRVAPRVPGFTLPVLGHPGQRVSLAAYAGRPVVVNFFASWCVPCKKETPLLARFFRAPRGRVVMIGVDVNDATAAALRFVRKAGVTYPVGVDRSVATASAWGVVAIPQTFFLDAERHVIRRVLGAITAAELARDTAQLAAASGVR